MNLFGFNCLGLSIFVFFMLVLLMYLLIWMKEELILVRDKSLDVL